MKVVLDTNVLVSGLLTSTGPCGQILELLIEGVLQSCIDGRIFAEYRSVVHRPQLAIPRAEADRILEFIRLVAEPVAALPLPIEVPDVDDLPFLEVAATARAILVTGNKRHFPKKARGSVVVVGPSELLDRLRAAS